jgi:hypothetical protein
MDTKRPSTIPGYVHPETATITRGDKYKTFTEGQKPKKKEKFGSTVAGNQYASLDTSQQTKKTQQEIEKERESFNKMYQRDGGK